ncbi:YciI family protein [Burkholderia sp. FERM BP-3421]|uniref:YciI family protein n=1 Tax=Burkholderia sp. FERM BP-3421 TaxID=1494466 RepID=UPI00235DDBF5|nr:YciI family protein [Burkholderia sp. FERM BP-3421]WDD91534.1 YciI family protein [Burkholderia sp. FERM BP-3421]
MYLIISNYIVDPAKVDPHRKSHADWVAKHVADGTFIIAGPKDTKAGGVILARSIDKAALAAIIAEDSFVTEKLVENQIVAFDPVFATEQFSALKAL